MRRSGAFFAVLAMAGAIAVGTGTTDAASAAATHSAVTSAAGPVAAPAAQASAPARTATSTVRTAPPTVAPHPARTGSTDAVDVSGLEIAQMVAFVLLCLIGGIGLLVLVLRRGHRSR